jgi:ribosomal protein S18 acetylase RimI-like enzyme
MAPTETPIDGHVKASQSSGIAVESAKLQDLPEIVAIHAQTNPESYLTCLGTTVLSSMYRHFIRGRYGIGLVAKDESGKIAGVAIGCEYPRRFYRTLALAVLPAYLWTSAARLFRPGPVGVGPAKRYQSQDNLFPKQDIVYFTQLNVAPAFQRRRVGSALAHAMYDEAVLRGHCAVYLITDRDNTSVRALHEKMGCKLVREFTTPAGIERCLYHKELGPSLLLPYQTDGHPVYTGSQKFCAHSRHRSELMQTGGTGFQPVYQQ